MPECHTCRHNGTPGAACLRCPGPTLGQQSSHGQTFVSLDAMAEHGNENTPSEMDIDSAFIATRSPEPYKAFSHALRCLLALDRKTRDIVCMRWMHIVTGLDAYTYPRIARKLRMTPQAVEERHRKALTSWPALGEMFKGKVAKHARLGSGDRRLRKNRGTK